MLWQPFFVPRPLFFFFVLCLFNFLCNPIEAQCTTTTTAATLTLASSAKTQTRAQTSATVHHHNDHQHNETSHSMPFVSQPFWQLCIRLHLSHHCQTNLSNVPIDPPKYFHSPSAHHNHHSSLAPYQDSGPVQQLE